jgi:hypothetical protein
MRQVFLRIHNWAVFKKNTIITIIISRLTFCFMMAFVHTLQSSYKVYRKEVARH